MRITQKQIKRLDYLESELKLLNSPHLVKVVHNIKDEISSQPEYVYIITEEGSWDYEYASNCECFNDFKTAVNRFNELKDQAIRDMNDWLDEEDINQDESIDEDGEQASFEIYESGDYSRLHDVITVHKKEVK